MMKNVRCLMSLATSSPVSYSLRKLTTTSTTTTTSDAVVAGTRRRGRDSILYHRLAAIHGGNDATNVAETLDEWLNDGNKLTKYHMIGFVNELRKYKKYNLAIQILEWWEKRGQDLTPGDHAIRLELLSKIEGVESAEKYFGSLPEHAKNKSTYGALLHCYCRENMVEKAMELYEKMGQLDFTSTHLVYNNLMSLLIRVGAAERVPPLIKEMKNKDITPNIHTYNYLMNSYAAMKDIDSAERVLEEMEEAGVKCDWTTYANLATIYSKAGLSEKANAVLNKVENMDKLRDRKAYHILISMYSYISNKQGVHRSWKSLNSKFPDTTNISYLVMLQALSRLDLAEELEKCFREWESSCVYYDIRVTNVLIDSYLGRDMIRKAKMLYEDAMKRGAEPNIRTTEMIMNFYLKNRQMDMALKYFETATLNAKGSVWKPSPKTVSTFFKYFEEEKDADGALSYLKLMKTLDCFDTNVYSALLPTCLDIKEYGIVMSE